MLRSVRGPERAEAELATVDRVARQESSRMSLAAVLRSRWLRRILLVGIGVGVAQQLTGIKGSVPQQAAALFNLGYVLQQAARHDEAGLAFRSALALEPALDRAWYGLALVLIHQRKFLDAVQALKKNTALQPMSPYGWYRLVQVWLALGQPDKARKVIAHLRQFEPRVAAQLEREHALTGVEHHATH